MTNTTLLKGATALLHDDHDQVSAVKRDILISGKTIARIASNISDTEAEKVLDCTGKLVSPGFVDTHHHVWQGQLKGKHANQTLLEYLPSGSSVNFFYRPDDVFWGELGGALEAVDSGITTLVDHAHVNYSPEHSFAAMRATAASGVRSIFGYCPTVVLDSFKPEFKVKGDVLAPWVMDTFDKLAKEHPFADGKPHNNV